MNKNNDAGGMGIFSKKHETIRKLARGSVENEIAPMAAQIDETGEYPGELRRKITDCGFHVIVVPKEYGGCGGDAVSVTIVTEEFIKVDASASTQLMPNSLSGGSLMMFGSEAQKQKYLHGMAGGKLIGAFTITESGVGSNMATITITAETDGDYYISDGRKCFITNSSCCDFVTVFAETDVNTRGAKRISALIVESAWEGFSRGAVENKMGMHSSPICDLISENVRVPRENLLVPEGQGFKICMATLDSRRIIVATQGLGIAQGALDGVVKYVEERVQFGEPISKLQNTQSEIVGMAAEVECGRQLVYHAVELKDAGKPYSKNAAMVKHYCSNLRNNIACRSLQFHGGYGYTRDHLIEHMFYDARFVAIYESTSEIQRATIANHVLGK